MGTFQNNEACSFVENIARLDWLVFIGVFLENSKFIQHFNAIALFVCLGVITFFYTCSVMFDLKCCIQRLYPTSIYYIVQYFKNMTPEYLCSQPILHFSIFFTSVCNNWIE